MKLRSVYADGSRNEDTEFDLEVNGSDGLPYDDPPVVIHCRMVPPSVRKNAEKQSRGYVKNPSTRGMQLETDWEHAVDLQIQYAVISWEGVLGADDKPLVCTDETKVHLPPHIKAQILEAAVTTEAADVTAASFREPARVV